MHTQRIKKGVVSKISRNMLSKFEDRSKKLKAQKEKNGEMNFWILWNNIK